MIWRLLEGEDVTPKYLVSASPKHGLHLAEGLLQAYVQPVPSSIYNKNHWLGTFRYNSFVPDVVEMGRWFFLASRLRQGHYYKGHVGWYAEIADFLDKARIAHVFIYRDLRDVAVSLAHHVTCDGGRANLHPAPAAYRALGGFDEVLAACITGMGPFPGVVDMWEFYAPWLDDKQTHYVRYEDTLADLEGTARGIVEYGLRRIVEGIWEVPLQLDEKRASATVAKMAQQASRTDLSPTFRKGQPGEWREVFTKRHKMLFKEAGGNEALERMGYEV